MSNNIPLTEQLRIVDGTKQAELDAQRTAILAEMDKRTADRRTRRHLLAEMSVDDGSGELPTVRAFSKHERKNFSTTRLLNAMLQKDARQHAGSATSAPDCLEMEASASISRDLGMVPPHGGCWLPLRISAAGLDTRTNTAGGYFTAPRIADIVDALRNQARVLQLGARLMNGVRFAPAFPIENNVMAATWVAQNPGSDVAASDPTFQQRVMSGRALAATTSVSRQLVSQSSADIENWIRTRIALAHGLALDRASIHGSGASNEPLGILGTAGIGNVPIGINGGSPTCDFLNSLEASIGAANADSKNCAFLTNSVMRSRLRKLPEMTGGVEPLWQDDGKVLGYTAQVSNQVRSDLVKGGSNDCSAILFGDWSQLVIAEFQGALEIVVDEFTARKQGMVEITSWGLYDLLLLQPAAMSAILDARNV